MVFANSLRPVKFAGGYRKRLECKVNKQKTHVMKRTLIAIALALAASTLNTKAQDEGGAPPPPPDGPPPSEAGPQGGPGGEHRRPKPPLEVALDANHDGVIDADEIANASEALKKLDKNGDGKLTQDELRPPRPPCGQGQGCSGSCDNGGNEGQGGPQKGGGDAGSKNSERPPKTQQ